MDIYLDQELEADKCLKLSIHAHNRREMSTRVKMSPLHLHPCWQPLENSRLTVCCPLLWPTITGWLAVKEENMTSPVLPDGQCHCDKSYHSFVVHRNFSFFFLQLESIRSVHSSAKYAFHKFLANLFFFGIYPLGLSYKYNSLFNTNATCEPISV